MKGFLDTYTSLYVSFPQAGDAVDSLLEELHYLDDQAEHMDAVAVTPDAIKEQIIENNVSNLARIF